jgi:hypothetical protein
LLSGLEARRVAFASAEDHERTVLLVERLEASHDLLALARGRLLLRDVHVRGGELLLRRSLAGWDLPGELLRRRAEPGRPLPRAVARGVTLHFQEDSAEGWRSADLGILSGHSLREVDGSPSWGLRLKSDLMGEWRGQVTVAPGADRLQVSASCSEFRFGAETLAALPQAVTRVLEKFAPEGSANLELSADVSLADGGKTQGWVSFEGASLAYEKFPYRLH